MQDLVALLFTAGEAFINAAAGEAAVHFELIHARVKLLVKLHRINVLTLGQTGLQGSAEKVGVADARNFMRILKREEQTGAAALCHVHRQNVLAIQKDLTADDFIVFVTAKDLRQGALA